MSNYKIYHMPHKKPMNHICTLGFPEGSSWKEIEASLDKFLRNNYKDLVYPCVELVLVNTETKNADFRFNYLEDYDDDFNNLLSDELIPYIDWLESDFLYCFVESYEETFDELFEGNAERINRVYE